MATETRTGAAPMGAAPAGAAPGSADPSMEDILASIRRILNEDEPAPAVAAPQPPVAPAAVAPVPPPVAAAPPPPPPVAAPVAPPVPEPLLLTEDMLVDQTIRQPLPVPPPAPVMAPPPPPVLAPPVVAAPAFAPHEALLAPETAAAASAAVSQLRRAVAADRSAPVTRSSGLTIEDLVREEVRLLLKDWLDQHLPPMVERLVRAEIQRVVGAGHL